VSVPAKWRSLSMHAALPVARAEQVDRCAAPHALPR